MFRFTIPQDTTKKGDTDFLLKKQSDGIPLVDPQDDKKDEKSESKKDNPFLKNVKAPDAVDNGKKKKEKPKDKSKEKPKEKVKTETKKDSEKDKKETVKKEVVKKSEQSEKPLVIKPKADKVEKPYTSTKVVVAQPAIVKKSDNFFQGHSLAIKNNFTALPRKTENQDGLFLILALVFGLFCWINYYQRKRLYQIISSFFIIRYIKQLIREENALLQRVFVIFSIVFILVFSVFLFQTANFYEWTIFNAKGFLLFTICILTVTVVYFIKILTVTFIGGVIEAENQVKEYFYNLFLINSFLGLLLLPLVVLIAYNPLFPKAILIKAGIYLFLATLMYRTIRSFFIGMGYNRFSVYHLFLYLCTLEILPLVVLIKLFIGKI